MQLSKKPSRHQLIKVITRLQGLIGEASLLHANDRDPNGFEKAQKLLSEAHELCIQARSFDPPTEAR